MNNSKYFSVDISNDIHLVKLHKTLEDAKQSCLDGAVDAYDFANDMDSFEEYSECDVPYAIYGAILGRAVSTTRELTDEEYESGDYCDDEITNPPEIVEINGWISTKERLPEEGKDVLIYVPTLEHNNGCDIAWLDDGKNNDGYCFVSSVYGYDLEDVTHWQPLPQPPKEG